MRKAAGVGVACLLAMISPVIGKEASTMTLAKGARVGIVNLLDAEVTHYHASTDIQDSFLKTHFVGWPVDVMLADALKQRLGQMGLVAVLLGASESLDRGREDFFVNGSVVKGLPKACAAQFVQMAAAEHLNALIVLAPGLNNSAHAGGARRRDLPDYLRGWGFVTKQGAAGGSRPGLFNMTQLLLIGASPEVASLRGREWGGSYSDEWPDFMPPADLKAIPAQELDKLKPLFATILSKQANRLLDQLEVPQ
jgi:hypothetical protein